MTSLKYRFQQNVCMSTCATFYQSIMMLKLGCRKLLFINPPAKIWRFGSYQSSRHFAHAAYGSSTIHDTNFSARLNLG